MNREIAKALERAALEPQPTPKPVEGIPAGSNGGFQTRVFLLDQLANGVPLGMQGDRLRYQRQGSAPGGRLTVDIGGGLENFAPGDVIHLPFNSGTVKRSLLSAERGPVVLIAETGDARLEQADASANAVVSGVQDDETRNHIGPTVLAGTRAWGGPGIDQTGANYLRDQFPPDFSAPNIESVFSVQGWRKIRVWISADDFSHEITAGELLPWSELTNKVVAGQDSSEWFAQEDEAVSLTHGDHGTALGFGGRLCFVFNVVGWNRMYLQARDLEVNGGVGNQWLRYLVEGIE